MGLLSWTIGLPLMPLRGTVALARVIDQQIEAERVSPAMARRRLEAAAAEQEREILDEPVSPVRVVVRRDRGDD